MRRLLKRNEARRLGFACVALLAIFPASCRTPADESPECDAVQVAADTSTKAPRPDEKRASFHFAGNSPEQREFVLVHEDGSYDYVERWNFGVPKQESLRDLDPRTKQDWEDDLPWIGKHAKAQPNEFEELPTDDRPAPGIDWDDQLQATFGWDWKVGCRMHVCERSDGSFCCHQRCEDGGAEGAAYEAPDQFACMNSTAGGDYDWFLAGLRDGGMTELALCTPL